MEGVRKGERERIILIVKMKDKNFLWTAEMFRHTGIYVFSTQLESSIWQTVQNHEIQNGKSLYMLSKNYSADSGPCIRRKKAQLWT